MGSQNRFFSIFGIPAYVKTHCAYQASAFKLAIDRNNSIKVSTNITSDVKLFENFFQKIRFIEEIFTHTIGETNN
jgi:hypothetical protein